MNTATRPAGDWRRVHCSEIHWVSSAGEIWSDRQNRLLNPWQNHADYYIVKMSATQRPMPVHRLVAIAFHGEPEPGQEVRHLNGCPTDNRAENLAWGTRTQNIHDILTHGRNFNVNKTHCPKGHPYDEANTRVQWIQGRARRFCIECQRIRNAEKTRRRQLAAR